MTYAAFLLVLSTLAAPVRAAGRAVHPLIEVFPTRPQGLEAVGPAGPERVAEALNRFKTEGWAILPAGTAIGPAAHAELQRLAKAALPPGSEPRRYTSGLPLQPTRESPGSPVLRRAFESLKLLVQFGLGEERARFTDSPTLDSVLDEFAEGSAPHADYGGYWNSTYALNHEGTILYPVKKGRVREVAAPARSVVLLSADERFLAAGVPATVHRAPAGQLRRRDVVKFGGDDVEYDSGARFLGPRLRVAAIEAEIERVKKWLRRRGR